MCHVTAGAFLLIAAAFATGCGSSSSPAGTDTAATVNGDAITGNALNLQVAALQASNPTTEKDEATALALGILIRQDLLYQDAVSRGLLPTQDQIDAAVKDYTHTLQALPSGSKDMQQTLEALGFDFPSPGADTLSELFKRQLASKNVLQDIRNSLPAAQQNNSVAVSRAEDDLVLQLYQQANVDIRVSATPILTAGQQSFVIGVEPSGFATPATGGLAPDGLIIAASVTQADFKFTPDAIGGAFAGTAYVAVAVTNVTDQGHTFTIDELHVNVGVAPGETKYITIPNQTGTYTFYCVIHRERGMTGTLQLIAQ